MNADHGRRAEDSICRLYNNIIIRQQTRYERRKPGSSDSADAQSPICVLRGRDERPSNH